MADSVSDSPQSLYAKNLKQLFGYPLRFPEPKPGLPSSYAENGLHIGDVGYVNDNGMFEVRFNICSPLDHDLHRDKDLAGLVGLVKFKPDEVLAVPNAFPPGRVICHGIRESHDDCSKHTRRQFISCSSSGAILILPSGAIQQNLSMDDEETFRKLAEKHAIGWCQFAHCSSLYLITGFYKTSSWYLASFHGVTPDEQVLERADEGRYDWDCRCDYRQSLGGHEENQTVLISGFKIQIRDWDKRPVVEKLPIHSRGVLSRLKSLASSLLGILIFFWKQTVFKIFSKPWDRDVFEDLDKELHVKRVPALSQPFHPADVINNYLLDKDPGVPVAITHDSQWLSMLDRNELFLEDMVNEGRFRSFLDGNYVGDRSSGSKCGLSSQKDLNSEVRNHCHDPTLPPKAFSLPVVDNIHQVIITHMRVENVVRCLRRMPIGFYILIQFNSARRSKIKPASVYNSIIEWDDEIMLPLDPAVNVQISVNASFEFEPMLGNGETLCTFEMSVSDLARGSSIYFPWGKSSASRPSLLITCEERRFDPVAAWSHGDDNLGCEDRRCSQAAEATDRGHDALLRYHSGQEAAELKKCVEYFKLALDLCPPHDTYHAVALFNYATASLAISDIEVAIASYRKALVLRPVSHPDRPMTLLHLAQALLYRQGRVRCELFIADEIEELATETKEICSISSYAHRAADVLVQTLKRYQVLASGGLTELNMLVAQLDLSARMPPDWYFDRSFRLMNFGTALYNRFEVTGSLDDLEKSISVMKEAAQISPNDPFDNPWILASLGCALSARFVQHCEIADLGNSISKMESAVNLVANNHFDKPWMLASLGDTLLARFIQHGDSADLERSILMTEDGIKLSPDTHSDTPSMLASLGRALLVRFIQYGDLADLEGSILTIENGIRLSPDIHPDKPWMLASLGHAFLVRFARGGDLADLKKSITMINDAVVLTPDGHFKKPRMLVYLGNALCTRFIQLGNIADLEGSISVMKNVSKLVPDGHFDKPWVLASLCQGLRMRYLKRGDIADLKSSISMLERSVELSSCDRFDRPWMLASLGDVLRLCFLQSGIPSNLDRSISLIEHAVKLTPDSHTKKPKMLTSLCDAYCVRFVHRWDIADLENSISIIKAAMKLIPDGHSDKPFVLGSFSDALRVRFVRDGDVVDLDNSISMLEEAVKLTPDGHFDKPWIFISLGDALRVRFVQRGDAADLESSISMIEDAVKLAPEVHTEKPRLLTRLDAAFLVQLLRGNVSGLHQSSFPAQLIAPEPSWLRDLERNILELTVSTHKADRLNSFSSSPFSYLWCLDNPRTLETVVSIYQDSIMSIPSDHPDKQRCLSNLAVSLRTRFWHSRLLRDFEAAISKYGAIVELPSKGDSDFEHPSLESLSLFLSIGLLMVRPPQPCLWMRVDGAVCEKVVSWGGVPEHLVTHRIRTTSDGRAVCAWMGCQRFVNRDNVVWHIRGAHLAQKRGDIEHSNSA